MIAKPDKHITHTQKKSLINTGTNILNKTQAKQIQQYIKRKMYYGHTGFTPDM